MKLFNLSLILAVVVATTVVGCGNKSNTPPYSTTNNLLGRTPCINGVNGALGAATGGQCPGYYQGPMGQLVPGYGPCAPGMTGMIGNGYPYAQGALGAYPYAQGALGAYPYAQGVIGAPGVPGSCMCNTGFYPNLSSNSCIPTGQCPATNTLGGIVVCNVQ